MWGPAQSQPARSMARQAARGVAGQGPSDAWGGRRPRGRAKPGPGREPTRVGHCGVRRGARARRRGQAAKALPGKGRATKGGGGAPAQRGVRLSACLRGRKRSRRRRRRQAWVEQHRRGRSPPRRAKSGSGRRPTRLGFGPEPAPLPGQSQATQGNAAPPCRAKPGSGREPTPAQIQPARSKAHQATLGVAAPKPSDAGEGEASSHRTKPWLVPAGSPLVLGPAQNQPALLMAAAQG